MCQSCEFIVAVIPAAFKFPRASLVFGPKHLVVKLSPMDHGRLDDVQISTARNLAKSRKQSEGTPAFLAQHVT